MHSLPDGTETHRNAWKIPDAGELAYDQLENRLSRSGVKQTTLDYTRDFAERRGIAERMGVLSEIELASPRRKWQAFRPSEREAQGRPRLEHHPRKEIVRQQTGPDAAPPHGVSAEQAERQSPENLSRAERSVPASWVGVLGGEGRDQAREDASTDRLHSPAEKNKSEDLAQDLCADPRVELGDRGRDHGERAVNEHDQQKVNEPERRNPFDGLRLGRGAAAEHPQQGRTCEDGPQIEQKRPEKAKRQQRGTFPRRPQAQCPFSAFPGARGGIGRCTTGKGGACGRRRRPTGWPSGTPELR